MKNVAMAGRCPGFLDRDLKLTDPVQHAGEPGLHRDGCTIGQRNDRLVQCRVPQEAEHLTGGTMVQLR
jgi:hypothetical protein